MRMILFRFGVVLLIAAFSPASQRAMAQNAPIHTSEYPVLPTAAYPAGSVQILMTQDDYDKLRHSITKYVGNRFYLNDQGCLGGRVGLADEVSRLFESTTSEKSGSVAPGIYFTSGIMLHGGGCQTGVLFTANMVVVMVATYREGAIGFEPNVLSIYSDGAPNEGYVNFLKSWASAIARFFLTGSVGDIVVPKAQNNIDIYDLSCKRGKGHVDLSRCLITRDAGRDSMRSRK